MKRLTLDDIKIPKPDFAASKLPKGQVITQWLIDWVKHSLEFGIADFGDIIPTKEQFAQFLDVSCATMQNSIRAVKNLGYFVSKQSIGTFINDINNTDLKSPDEITRGGFIQTKIKRIIIEQNTKLNSPILSINEFCKIMDVSKNTVRFTLDDFERQGYLERKKIKGNKYNWIYIKEFELTKEELEENIHENDYTLINKLVSKIQKYIEKTYKPGEKILPNLAFSNMFEVSIKTINDAMKVLNNRKIILSRRGRYGTVYLGGRLKQKQEFVSSERRKITSPNYSYSWQKTLGNLEKYIIENYKQGDKIAPIRTLAALLNVSPNTIRRALSSLIENGYLISKRGKTGGIFIVEIPNTSQDAYRWLALNIDAIKNQTN